MGGGPSKKGRSGEKHLIKAWAAERYCITTITAWVRGLGYANSQKARVFSAFLARGPGTMAWITPLCPSSQCDFLASRAGTDSIGGYQQLREGAFTTAYVAGRPVCQQF